MQECRPESPSTPTLPSHPASGPASESATQSRCPTSRASAWYARSQARPAGTAHRTERVRSGVPHQWSSAPKVSGAPRPPCLCGRRTRRLERLDSSLHTSPASIGLADSPAVGGIGSEVVKNDAMIRPGVCLLDYANVASTLRPILDATACVPRGHPRQPGRRWRSGDGLIVVGLGEDRLGMDVREIARQVVLRRKLGKQGRALYPVRLSTLFPLGSVDISRYSAFPCHCE